jgi:hypothetical protein
MPVVENPPHAASSLRRSPGILSAVRGDVDDHELESVAPVGARQLLDTFEIPLGDRTFGIECHEDASTRRCRGVEAMLVASQV